MFHSNKKSSYQYSMSSSPGGISTSENKSDVHSAYTSDRPKSRDHFSSSFDSGSRWDPYKRESTMDTITRKESESTYTPYDSRRKDSYSSYSSGDYRGSRRTSDSPYASSSDTRNTQKDSYSSYLTGDHRESRRDSDLSSSLYDTRNVQKDSSSYSFRGNRERDSDISYMSSTDTRNSQMDYTPYIPGDYARKSRMDSGISSSETRRDSDSSSIYSSSSSKVKEVESTYEKQVEEYIENGRTGDEVSTAATKKKKDEVKKPEFIIKPRKQFGDAGKSAKFKASFEGKADLHWERLSEIIEPSDKYKIYQSLDFNYLEICSVDPSDAGIYTCIIENSVGCDTASAILEVFENFKPPPPTPAPKKPLVELPLLDTEVIEGTDQVELKCKFSNVTAVQWLKDGVKLPANPNFKGTFDGINAVLVLRKISSGYIGCYECVATSSKHGEEVRTSCVLTVMPQPSKQKLEPPIFIRELQDIKCIDGDLLEMVVQVKDKDSALNGEKANPPQILEAFPNELSVKSGEAASFTVKYTGADSNVRWYRGRQPVDADDRLILDNRSGISSFTIQNTLPTDRGAYNVVVANRMGNDSAIVRLTVEAESIFDDRNVKISTGNFEDFYTLKEAVGKGRFGTVHKCIEKSSNRLWAAKIIKCKAKQKPDVRNEIEIMNGLTHPKVLRLWDAYESPTGFVIVTEFVCGGELFERIAVDDFVLTEPDCAHFVHQICEGVRYLHVKEIIHLDLKPENILCIAKSNNLIKIIDFGLARRFQPGDSIKVLFGTPDFIAPEVVNYDEISFATDLWSLGVICYVLVSGLAPFTGDTDLETLGKVTQAVYDFDDYFEDISESAKDFIRKLLVKNKNKRLTIHQCLEHEWLSADTVDSERMKRLSTDKLKTFIARRKWQVQRQIETVRSENRANNAADSISGDSASTEPQDL